MALLARVHRDLAYAAVAAPFLQSPVELARRFEPHRHDWSFRLTPAQVAVYDCRASNVHHTPYSSSGILVINFQHCGLRGQERLGQELDVPVRSMHPDPLSIWDEPRGLLHAHDGGQAVLPRDHCPMGHQASDLRDEATYGHEQG